MALLKYVENNKKSDNDWFRLESNKDGTRWFGKCWYIHEMLKYEFEIEFDIPITYPSTSPEIAIPELDGKTSKMYRGGKICLSDHFKPLWARNAPKFGIAHALALGLGPWLAVEVPDLIQKGQIVHKTLPSSIHVVQAMIIMAMIIMVGRSWQLLLLDLSIAPPLYSTLFWLLVQIRLEGAGKHVTSLCARIRDRGR
ncbi:UFC1 [Cordylochernes scorpioides]|uniref:Ubiquitin-fold modifier-conjugating enzyme 1 n=1 Tax=Cordylochernes scorpioides TaxID=51811 RepID=A0ABY6KZP2_9ARAC|nr:UFC1 [Cordylochernes scorpioides]